MIKEKQNKVKLITISLIILLLSQVFITALTVSSFEKVYLESFTSSFNIFEKYFKRKIENALRFGKPLNRFIGIETLMEEFKKKYHEINNILIYEPDGKILYSILENKKNTYVASSLHIDFSKENNNKYKFVKDNNIYHVLDAIRGPDKSWKGTISFSFNEEIINSKNAEIWSWNIEKGAYLLMGAIVLLIIMLDIFIDFRSDFASTKKKIFIIIFIVLGLAQILYSYINSNHFYTNYMEITRSRVISLTSLMKEDIERILNKNINIGSLKNIDAFLEKSIRPIPEIKEVKIIAQNKEKLYQTSKTKISVQEKTNSITDFDSRFEIVLPLLKGKHKEKQATAGYIKVLLSEKTIQRTVKGIYLDSLTVILISFLFTIELIIFLSIFIDKNIRIESKEHAQREHQEFNETLGRPAAFSFLFVFALPVSFIPLHMKSLYEPLWIFSEEIALGLPISVEMLCALFTALIAGFILDKKGWHVPFLLGVVLSAVGSFYSATASSGMYFVIYRGISGLGYGLAWMSIQGFVLRYSSEKNKARGIANLVAGIISGHICGTATGAMIAERIGYKYIFYLTTGLSIIPIVFVILFLRAYMIPPPDKIENGSIKFKDLFNFLTNKNIFAIIFLVIIPFSLAQIGLLLFATPIYLSDQGISQSSIGRVMMIYGICSVYISPFIARYIDRSQNKRIFISLGGLSASIGLVLLNYQKGYLAIAMAIFMLGLASSLGGSAQSVFILKFKVTRDLGPGKAVSIHRAADKLGQMLGPIVFASLMGQMGVENGIVMIGVILLISSLLFILIVRE